MANGNGHMILTRAALEVLPSWGQDILASVRDSLANEYCMYGDDYFGHKEELGKYVEMPDGRLPMDPWELNVFRKDAPGEDYLICAYYDLMRSSFSYFAAKCIASLRAGNVEDFAKFTGTIAHVIEDCGCPPHSVGTTISTDMKFIKMLLPCNDKEKALQPYHSILEAGYEPFSLSYKPRLLGLSPEEISFNIFERFSDMLGNSIAQIIPMLNAFYQDDRELMKKHLCESGKFSSAVLADFLYSVICAGTSRFEKSEEEKLKIVFLSEYTPEIRTGWMPCPYTYPEIRKAPYSLTSNFTPEKLSLLINGKEKTFEKGFGLGVPFKAKYILPENTYKRFESEIGINCRLGAKTGIVFKVLGDNRELIRIECRDISKSNSLSVDISTVRELTLELEQTDNPGQWADNTHAVWGDPKLIK